MASLTNSPLIFFTGQNCYANEIIQYRKKKQQSLVSIHLLSEKEVAAVLQWNKKMA